MRKFTILALLGALVPAVLSTGGCSKEETNGGLQVEKETTGALIESEVHERIETATFALG